MIHRARLFFVVALLIAVVILVANFPVGALLQERATVRTDSVQLAALQAENRQLSSQVKALHDPAVVGQIAHSEYGLTEPAPSSAPNPLADNPIPFSDLLPSDAILDPSVPVEQPAVHEPSFWHRVIGTLEFWHSLF